ncbi:MAG: biopolymer transporter ExbD [candidate division KSB1 bacterium]|nr:biopolymer transporter ExbD [candidate division KSB1 bacterium]MDZ7335492.1 biopolymer transporter ExbD [candidate division KSB1 bacterium]MDZ7376492.1 biopolymer transporter ExbD [candidate division KSB1 bacterium]MDZ7399222.1 biopolymer transporter ExbD [candidate division KSB1 bacterium]
MTSGNATVIRLIDVVLILLFGFISISEISSRSVLELPKSTQMAYVYPDKEELLIIGITKEGKFLVEDESKVITDFGTLREYVETKRLENIKNKIDTRVRIRSNWNTPIKYTLALANLCDQLGIPKGVDVILENKK